LIQRIITSLNARDITKHKRSEAVARRTAERYRTLFNSMDEGFCVVEVLFDQNNRPKDYRFIELNPAFE
jgi:PAS domain-containing protein